MTNKWKEVWEKRSGGGINWTSMDTESIFLKLKELDGFDIVEGGMSYDAFFMQFQQIKNELEFDSIDGGKALASVYEVGCGSGANLFLFQEEHIQVGGSDYAEGLVSTAREVLEASSVKELSCGDAAQMPTDILYDGIFSNGVFSYFENYDYAEAVLEKMLAKTRRNLVIVDISDLDKKEDFLRYRRHLIENYDERYEGLDKLFYPRQFFLDFAARHRLNLKFTYSKIPGYWNNDFIFGCNMYRA